MNIQNNYGSAPYGKPVDSSSGGTTVFIYGILGLVLCMVFAPVAWIKGNEYRTTCLAMGVEPSGLGVAGRVLGIIGTVLTILYLGGGLLMFIGTR